MTSLQNLQAELWERTYPYRILSGASDFHASMNFMAEKIYTAALQEALGKVPGKEDVEPYHQWPEGWNACREKTIQGIQSLIPKNN